MNAEQMRVQIEAAMIIAEEGGGFDFDVESIVTFADAGIMTRSEGFVVTTADRDVFHIAVQQIGGK
jgi:hypothetical protein